MQTSLVLYFTVSILKLCCAIRFQSKDSLGHLSNVNLGVEMEQPVISFTNGHLKNERPIFGILTLPGDMVEDKDSYISAGYVKWLESAGVRIIPIKYNSNEEEIRKIFTMVNGVFFTGGNYPLRSNTRWFKTGKLLFELAVEANKKGDYFPVHGHCLGLQLLLVLISEDEYCLSSVDAYDHASELHLTAESRSSHLLSSIPSQVLYDMQHHPISMHNHHFGLLLETLPLYPSLDAFFNIIATTKDRVGRVYASIVEAKEFPFTGFAFHPEKVVYEWTTVVNIPHSKMAVDAAYALAQAVAEQARRNDHKGADIVEEDKYLIYNWPEVFSGKHKAVDDETFFEQIYIFSNYGAKDHQNEVS